MERGCKVWPGLKAIGVGRRSGLHRGGEIPAPFFQGRKRLPAHPRKTVQRDGARADLPKSQRAPRERQEVVLKTRHFDVSGIPEAWKYPMKERASPVCPVPNSGLIRLG